MKKKSELFQHIGDFHRKYLSLYSLYEDLRGEVRKKVYSEDDDTSSASTSDSESTDSTRNDDTSEDLEDVVLKDKLTSTVETIGLDSQSSFEMSRDESRENLKDLEVQDEKYPVDEGEQIAQISELEEKCRQKDDHFSVLQKTFVENEEQYKSRFEDLMEQANSSELEMNILMKQVNFLQQELETMRNQKEELGFELEKKSKEASNYLNQIENLNGELSKLLGTMEEREYLKLQLQDLELEVKSLNTKRSDLEEKIVRINDEAYRWRVENEELQKKISELQRILLKKENELNKIKNDSDALQNEKNRLEIDLETEKENSAIIVSSMEKKNIELTEKLDEIMEKHRQQSKSSFQMAERKIEEMAEEFRKQFEDNLRILSRRIRVAEQLHAENKDCYLKTKEIYMQENKELQERYKNAENGFKNIKKLSLTVNDMLNSLDSVGLKFEECTANFLNRISKVSCELKFTKDWVRRKNKAAMHFKDDLNCLLSQMDEKEAEILVFRERVWKSENKVRELEKMNKHNEEGMLVTQEEKREAIRQLCVWIDYHRSRSDYYKKMLTEVTPGYRRIS